MRAALTGNFEAAQNELAFFQTNEYVGIFHDHDAILDAYMNETNIHGEIALMIAAENGHLNIVELILKQYATQEARDIAINQTYTYQDETLLMRAVQNGWVEMVQLLLEYHADTTLINTLDQTAEMIAKIKKSRARCFTNKRKFGRILKLLVAHRERRLQLVLLAHAWDEESDSDE